MNGLLNIIKTDRLGINSYLSCDNRERLILLLDAAGGEIEYKYDAVGNLIAVTDELNRTINVNLNIAKEKEQIY
jgi:YD repeat-containing protein